MLQVLKAIHLDLIMQPRAPPPPTKSQPQSVSPERHRKASPGFSDGPIKHRHDCRKNRVARQRKGEVERDSTGDVCNDACCQPRGRPDPHPRPRIPTPQARSNRRPSLSPPRSRPTKRTTNTCTFCDETNELFAEKELMNGHYKEKCPCLAVCQYCDRVSWYRERQLRLEENSGGIAAHGSSEAGRASADELSVPEGVHEAVPSLSSGVQRRGVAETQQGLQLSRIQGTARIRLVPALRRGRQGYLLQLTPPP